MTSGQIVIVDTISRACIRTCESQQQERVCALDWKDWLLVNGTRHEEITVRDTE